MSEQLMAVPRIKLRPESIYDLRKARLELMQQIVEIRERGGWTQTDKEQVVRWYDGIKAIEVVLNRADES